MRFFRVSKKAINILLTICGLMILWIFGMLTVGLYYKTVTEHHFSGELFITSMVVNAAYMIGILVGFLFGIPRALQESPSVNGQKPISLPDRNSAQFKVNTNLEQVSDWLTKILVGVGLTQFNSFSSFLENLANKIISSAPNFHISKPLVMSAIVFFLIIGFLGGYIVFRMWLTGAFSEEQKDHEGSIVNSIVNLDFDIKSLSLNAKNLLQDIIIEFEKGNEYLLSKDFHAKSKQFEIIKSIEKRHIVRPKNYDRWEAGKAVELTPIAKKLLSDIKRELSNTSQ